MLAFEVTDDEVHRFIEQNDSEPHTIPYVLNLPADKLPESEGKSQSTSANKRRKKQKDAQPPPPPTQPQQPAVLIMQSSAAPCEKIIKISTQAPSSRAPRTDVCIVACFLSGKGGPATKRDRDIASAMTRFLSKLILAQCFLPPNHLVCATREKISAIRDGGAPLLGLIFDEKQDRSSLTAFWIFLLLFRIQGVELTPNSRVEATNSACWEKISEAIVRLDSDPVIRLFVVFCALLFDRLFFDFVLHGELSKACAGVPAAQHEMSEVLSLCKTSSFSNFAKIDRFTKSQHTRNAVTNMITDKSKSLDFASMTCSLAALFELTPFEAPNDVATNLYFSNKK